MIALRGWAGFRRAGICHFDRASAIPVSVVPGGARNHYVLWRVDVSLKAMFSRNTIRWSGGRPLANASLTALIIGFVSGAVSARTCARLH